MTTRIAAALKAAQEAERRIFASLPYKVRFASMFSVLAAMDAAAWGRALVMQMIRAGVEMPDIDGVPALDWAKKVGFKPERLPRGYVGSDKLGISLFHEALLKVGNPSDAGEFMQEMVIGFLSGTFKFAQVSLDQAKAYCVRIVKTRATNWRRDKLDPHRNDISTSPGDDDEDGGALELESDRDFIDNADVIDQVMRHPDVVQGLKKIHEDAPLFLDLLMDGVSQAKIIGDKMLPNYQEGSIQNWAKKKEKMFTFLQDQFKKHLPKTHEYRG